MSLVDSYTLKILRTIEKHPDLFSQDLYNQFSFESETLDELLALGYLAQPPLGDGRFWNKYHLTTKGRMAITETSHEKSSNRGTWFRWVLDIIVAIASFALGYFFGAA